MPLVAEARALGVPAGAGGFEAAAFGAVTRVPLSASFK
jgi:hypothetical protein